MAGAPSLKKAHRPRHVPAPGLPAGSIVVAGYACWTDSSGSLWQQVAVGHLFADGSADTTFGTAGTGISLLTPLYGNGENTYGRAIDPDGRIVVSFETGVNSNQAAFARFTAP